MIDMQMIVMIIHPNHQDEGLCSEAGGSRQRSHNSTDITDELTNPELKVTPLRLRTRHDVGREYLGGG